MKCKLGYEKLGRMGNLLFRKTVDGLKKGLFKDTDEFSDWVIGNYLGLLQMHQI